MLYESFNITLEARRKATHASAWRKWEKWVPKLIRMIGFRQNFEVFPEAPGWPEWVFYDVFWCPGPLGTFLEWSWMNSGNFICSWFFSKFWAQNVLCAAVLRRVSSVCNNSWINLFYKRDLSMGEADVFFLFIAPEKNKKYNSKVCHFWVLAPGEGT